MNRLTRCLPVALALALGGCVGPVEIAPLPYAHPANPDAPAGANPPVGAALAPSADADPAGGGMNHAGMNMGGMDHSKMKQGAMPAAMDMMRDEPAGGAAQATGRYQCPMHSHVRSDKPGRCPICVMKMMDKSGPEGRQGDHER